MKCLLVVSQGRGWLRRTVFSGLCSLAVCCGLSAARAAPAEVQEPAVVTLRGAEFVPAASPEAAPQHVALPDTWAQRQLPVHGAGRYSLRFTLDAVTEQPWALSLARISSSRRITLNGSTVDDELSAGLSRPVSEVIALPASLLRIGTNELVVEVEYRFRGGLSEVLVGPASVLRRTGARSKLWSGELPRALNMGMALLAVFMLLLRWRRPSEREIGLFGGLTLLGSVRNYSYLIDLPLLSNPMSDWLFFSAQVWIAALFALFSLSLHVERRRGALDAAVPIAALVLSLVALLSVPFGGLTVMRTVVYPFLLVAVALSLGVVWRAMRKRPTVTNVALMLGFTGLIAASLHDYAFQQGHLPVTDTFWVPYVMPFGLGIYGLLLIERFVRATSEVERLNVELEHRVQQRTQALQSANAAKTRFLAAASHDLRQPVAAIGLMVSLMREQLAAPALRKMIDRVDEALASMEALLKGLLDLSRLESGTARARPQRVQLQPLFDAIALHESEAAAQKGLRLRFRPTTLSVQSDPVLLEQVLRNLISNAVRYTERGGVLVTARTEGASTVKLSVWDTGVGIAQENQAEVFEEFVQLGNPARESARGLGLGLSIVKRSAAVLGHPLTLRSQLGRGSCFGLAVPRAPDALLPPQPKRAGPQPLRGLSIVLVEDDDVMRTTMVERLVSWGAYVNAFDGVPALRTGLPPKGSPRDGRFADLLISDQRLPGGSGLLVIELVRQRCGATRAMVITGDTSPGDLALLQSTGVPVLHKPFRAEALLAAIEAALLSTALGELPAA